MARPWLTPLRLRIAGLALLFLAMACLAISSAPTAVDRGVMHWILGIRPEHPAWTAFFRAITRLGNEPNTYFLILGAAAILGVLRYRGVIQLARADLVYWTLVALGGQWLNQLLKLGFRRERPDEAGRLVRESTFSFPSGHSVFASLFFGLIAIVAIHAIRRPSLRALRWLVPAGCVILACTIGASRIWLGVHYPSDVLGGLALGGLVATASWESWIGRRRAGGPTDRGPA